MPRNRQQHIEENPGKSRKKFMFNGIYFSLAFLILIIEVLIALFVHDRIIRPYIGDVLVVILIYCLLMAFLNLPVYVTAISVLLFAFTVEFLQYLDFIEKTGLQNSPLARTIIGTSFAWMDIASYIAGTVIIILTERMRFRHIRKKPEETDASGNGHASQPE